MPQRSLCPSVQSQRPMPELKTTPPTSLVPGFQASGINFQVSFPSPGSLNTLGFPPFSSKPVWDVHAVSRAGGQTPKDHCSRDRGAGGSPSSGADHLPGAKKA